MTDCHPRGLWEIKITNPGGISRLCREGSGSWADSAECFTVLAIALDPSGPLSHKVLGLSLQSGGAQGRVKVREVPRRGTISLAVGETYGVEHRNPTVPVGFTHG